MINQQIKYQTSDGKYFESGQGPIQNANPSDNSSNKQKILKMTMIILAVIVLAIGAYYVVSNMMSVGSNAKPAIMTAEELNSILSKTTNERPAVMSESQLGAVMSKTTNEKPVQMSVDDLQRLLNQ